MPKKGSRRVLVQGVAYRFMVRSEGPNRETLRITVEPEDYPGHVLIATFGAHLLSPVGGPQVEQIIRYARRQGWAPNVMTNFALGDTAIQEMISASLA